MKLCLLYYLSKRALLSSMLKDFCGLTTQMLMKKYYSFFYIDTNNSGLKVPFIIYYFLFISIFIYFDVSIHYKKIVTF